MLITKPHLALQQLFANGYTGACINTLISQEYLWHWASNAKGVINKHYFYSWSYEGDYISEPIYGPTYSMWQCIQYITYNYEENDFCTNDDISRLAVIARHICPDKKLFDNWLSEIMKKATGLFPYKKVSENPAIPRQFFFESDYDYETADNLNIINDFLSNLDYKENDLLNPPKKMISKGFQGTPYKYEPQ